MEESSSAGRSERGEEKTTCQYFGWIYHLGVNSVGREFCHLRFLVVKEKRFIVYKRDPHENPDIKPIRQGFLGATLMVQELGSRKVNNEDLYVIRVYNRLDENRKGEIACATAEEARKWKEAFEQAKQKAEYEFSTESSARDKLVQEMEMNLRGRHRVRRYASGFKRLIKIGQGPESLTRRSSKIFGSLDGFEIDGGDTLDAHQWKCVRTMSGIRIFEDISSYKSGKGVLVKSVGVIDATADNVLEVFLSIERQKRYEWDMLMGDLELIESHDEQYDVVYGTYDPKYQTRWHSKRDFIFSRQWFRAQDGTYTILQFPSINKKKPPRSGYRRTKINPSTWEIRNLNTPMGSDRPRCLVTQTLEINSESWYRWKNSQQYTKFEKSIPYALLCQVAGLKEYIGANPEPRQQSSGHSRISSPSMSGSDFADLDVQDEFYDAITSESLSSDDESDEDKELNQKPDAQHINKELDSHASPIKIDRDELQGSLRKGEHDKDTNCWTSPGGEGFMVRGKNYLKDNSKVAGGDPLLKLIAVDWLKVDKAADRIALHHKNLVQSEAGKNLPFVLVFNLQVPAKPNYSLALYYASDRPIKEDSLLAKFLDGDDTFRDSRFKLIPSIVEGYWMVKRAVGTKACLLGKAVTCKYFRQDNFFEIDVDIGSSSVARSVIGLVMGYVTSLVVDLAILIEAKEEAELPEYLLGTVRLNRIKIESAVPLEV